MRKKGLGKGLDALISSNDLEEAITTKSQKDWTKVKLSQIEPNYDQPRKAFDEDAINELAESIKIYGVLQPLIVNKKGKLYEIIAGERRWRAAKKAGLDEVPVMIKQYSDKEIVEVSLIENIQRQNLNLIEEALAYQRLIEEFELKQDEVAERVGKSRSAVANIVRLLQLSENVQKMLIDEMLSMGHARCLLSVKKPEEQYNIALTVFDKQMTVRETEKYIKDYLKPSKKQKKTKEVLTPEMEQLEKAMAESLGTKVKLQHKKNHTGKIEISYFSEEELERLIQLIYKTTRGK